MLVDLSDSPGFRRANLAPITPPLALIIVGGLRELTALYVEDGQDVHGITETAVTASIGDTRRWRAQLSISRADFSNLSAISA